MEGHHFVDAHTAEDRAAASDQVITGLGVAWTIQTAAGYSYSKCRYIADFTKSGNPPPVVASSSIDNCAAQCVAASTCIYFTLLDNQHCALLDLDFSKGKAIAMSSSSQYCGFVTSRPVFKWTETDGPFQTSPNCDFGYFGFSITGTPYTKTQVTANRPLTLANCKAACTQYAKYCNFFTLSTAGVCTMMKTSLKLSPIPSSANSNRGWVPSAVVVG